MAEQRRRRTRKRDSDTSPASPTAAATVRCPYCHDDVNQDALAARCALCRTVHHPTCFDERRGCSVAGCSSKVADIVKGWRPAFAPCKVCSNKIYLDENVFLCKSCEAPHHAACLETSAGCAECGAGEGTMLYAGAYREATEGARRFAAPFLFLRWLVPAAIGAAWVDHDLGLALRAAIMGGSVCLWFLFTWIGWSLTARGRRRARELAQPRSTRVSPATKPTEPDPQPDPAPIPLPPLPPS